MRRILKLLATTALSAGLSFGALVACMPVEEVRDYSYGEGQLAACTATSCARLDLDRGALPDYTQLAALSHVTALMISHTDFANLADIAPMTQLTELHIGLTNATDLTGLSAFQNLALLHIQGVAPESWEPLAQLTGLRELAIGHRELTDLTFITASPQLRRLRIFSAGDGASFEGLGRHRGLREIELNTDSFTDLSPLLNLPNLRTLSISVAQWDYARGLYADDQNADVIRRLKARGVRVIVDEIIVMC